MTYKIEIQPANVSFQSKSNILDDALLESIPLEHSCKTGDCGMCTAEVVSGEVQNEDGSVISSGEILTCQCKALSDVVLNAKYYPELANISIQTVPCKVSNVEYVTDDIISLSFRFPPTTKFEYLSGQYVDLSFQGIKRSYSIANASNALKEIKLYIRKVPEGKMSNLLFDSVINNKLMRMEGPKGTFFVREGNKPLIFIATGTGISSVKAMVESLINVNDPRSIHIYWGMRYQSEIFCKELIRYSENYTQIHFTSVLSREFTDKSKHGYVQDCVLDDFKSLADVDVYACGSLDMIKAAKTLFIKNELSSEAFYFDAFTPAK